MPITKLYYNLLELPLFQGMSHNDLEQVVAHTKFGFHKASAGRTLFAEGDKCEQMVFIVKGKLRVTTNADNKSFRLEEYVSAPEVLQPERIFGLSQRYTKTFVATEDCQLLSISKAEVLKLLQEHIIFCLNLLNIISTQSQRISHLPWRIPPIGIRNKIIKFIETHSTRPAGAKKLYIKMETFATLISESRLNVSRELNKMQEEGIIIITRGIIYIPSLEQLIQMTT